MPEQIWQIGASGWFYYKAVCYDARSYERKKNAQLFIKLPALCGSLKFITLLTTARHVSPSRAKLIQSTKTHFKTHFMEVFVLLERKAAYADSCLPTFRDNLSVSSSRTQQSACSILDDGTNIVSRNVCKQLPPSTVQHPTRSKTSTRPRRKPTTLYPCCYCVSLHLWLSLRFLHRILHAFLCSTPPTHVSLVHVPPFSSSVIRVV